MRSGGQLALAATTPESSQQAGKNDRKHDESSCGDSLSQKSASQNMQMDWPANQTSRSSVALATQDSCQPKNSPTRQAIRLSREFAPLASQANRTIGVHGSGRPQQASALPGKILNNLPGNWAKEFRGYRQATRKKEKRARHSENAGKDRPTNTGERFLEKRHRSTPADRISRLPTGCRDMNLPSKRKLKSP